MEDERLDNTIQYIKWFIKKEIDNERLQINKKWLSLDLSNDNKENWSRELDKFGVYMQGLRDVSNEMYHHPGACESCGRTDSHFCNAIIGNKLSHD